MAQVFVPPVEADRFPPLAPDERLWPEAAWPVESPISMQAPPPAGDPASLSPAAAGAPPGWYPEPRRERFWDGARWTDETRPAGPPAPVAVPVAPVVAMSPAPAPMAGAPVSPAPVAMAGAPMAPAPVAMAPVAVVSAMPEPAPAPTPSAQVGAPVPGSRGLAHELVTLVLVLGLAIAAGALVAAIGIVFTV